MKVGDILLESIISDPVRTFERFLSELGELKMSRGFGVEGEESGVEIFDKFLEGFLSPSDGSVG